MLIQYSLPLHIESWFSDPAGSPGCTVASLPACTLHGGKPHPGECAVGYGENNVDPWGFDLQEGEDVGVGFFKVIASNFAIDTTPLAQRSPFEDSPGVDRRTGRWTSSAHSWLAQTATVVYRSTSSGA